MNTGRSLLTSSTPDPFAPGVKGDRYIPTDASRGSCEEKERRGAAAIGNSIVAIATPITSSVSDK
ncbi:hypothetical protein H0E87_015767 [Populus deltoides]|uniref:Uncharacterized protein n=1 Tax=Populus deltoides TaxID=3696 RepID=A0A8T2Y6H0_POPDE|nr:hypothetical protein H0E87_015767 [Populus deltoides]